MVVGIEFFPPTTADDPERATALLGFRSLWTEHAITLQIKEKQTINGIGVQPNQPSQWRSSEQGLGLESVRLWLTGGVCVANGHDEGSDGWLDATCTPEEQLQGFVAVFGVSGDDLVAESHVDLLPLGVHASHWLAHF